MAPLYPQPAGTRDLVATLPRMQPEGRKPGLRNPAVAVLGALALLAVIVALAAAFGLGPFGGGGGAALAKAQVTAKGDQGRKQAHDKFAALQKSPPDNAQRAADLTPNLIENPG